MYMITYKFQVWTGEVCGFQSFEFNVAESMWEYKYGVAECE